MTVHEDLPTQYHQQDTDYYCGAACAQMVLEQCGSGLLDQAGLYTDNHSHSTTESGWYTAPDGLAWTLNNRQSGRYFVLDALSTEDAISRMIAWTIHHYRVSPVAMVYGSAHWIVVRGYTASDMPSSSTDVGYSLSGFDVNNPWPPTPSPGPPPPHSAGDVCGSGGTRGVADEHISITMWRDTYMTGIPSGHWAGKFVAVCDPEPPPERHPDRQETPRARFDGVELISAEAAAEVSWEGLKEAGLLERDHWSRALEGTSVVGDPVLVTRLDRVDSHYWIVPRGRGSRVGAAVTVDARFGTYQGSRMVEDPEASALLRLQRKELEAAVFDGVHRLPGRLGEVRIRPEVTCVSPHWVWKPCRESLSPYYPFRLVSVGPFRFYLRSDGRMFPRLTTGRGI